MLTDKRLYIGALSVLAVSVLLLGVYFLVDAVRVRPDINREIIFFEQEEPIWFDKTGDLKLLYSRGMAEYKYGDNEVS